MLNKLREAPDFKGESEQKAIAQIDGIPVDTLQDKHLEFFVTETETLPEGAFKSLTILKTSVSDAYYDFVNPTLTDRFGYTVERLDPEYGEADLYSAQHQDPTTPSFYFSLVKLKLGSGAFLVLWADDPRQGSQ